MDAAKPIDLAIVGGGLAGGLLALALRALRPELRVVLAEAGDTLGGNHIWSCFTHDIAPEHRWLVEPLIEASWPGHDVRFESHARSLPGAYASLTSERLDAAVRAALPQGDLLLGTAATHVTADGMTLADGRRIGAGAVIDARGAGDLSALDLGYQKFAGRLYALDAPHGLPRPVIMDAAVDQDEGYRFVYLLPFSASTVFVEDTYYSTDPTLDVGVLEGRITAYVRARGWTGRPAGRAETGVLPVCMGGDFERYLGPGGVPKIGLAGGFFHAMTGYSLPDAVRVAHAIAAMDDLSAPAINAAIRGMARRHWRGQLFYRLLATMLFRAADPPERHRILARFYRLDPDLIGRFYSGRSTRADKARILCGRPPVPLGRAIRALGANVA